MHTHQPANFPCVISFEQDLLLGKLLSNQEQKRKHVQTLQPYSTRLYACNLASHNQLPRLN